MNIETPKQLIQSIKKTQFSVHQKLRLLRSDYRFYRDGTIILFFIFCLYTFFNHSFSFIISFIWLLFSILWLIDFKTNSHTETNCTDALIKLKFIRDILENDENINFNFMLSQYKEVIKSFE